MVLRHLFDFVFNESHNMKDSAAVEVSRKGDDGQSGLSWTASCIKAAARAVQVEVHRTLACNAMQYSQDPPKKNALPAPASNS